MKYKGMLHIRCQSCGHDQQYYQKNLTDEHICNVCRCRTELANLRKMYINCECGNRLWYNTNIPDKIFDACCHNCSQPVAVEFDRKRNNFMTINRDRKHGKQ